MTNIERASQPKNLAGRIWAKIHGPARSGTILRTAAVSVLNRALSIVASLLTVPVVLHHVGRERYGIWMAAIALSAIFTASDGGVSKGLIAMVAKAHGAGDRPQIRALVSSALATTIPFVLILLAVVLLLIKHVDWQWVLNLSQPELGREAAGVIATICICYAASFLPTVIREARLGLQEGATVQVWDLAGLVLGFAGLLIAVLTGCGLVVIAGVWTGAAVVTRTIAALTFLAGPGRDLIPARAHVDLTVCRRLLAAGAVFTLYTVTQALAAQSDQVLIARFLGAASVADYVIVQRLFMQAQVLVTLGLISQWPAYGEALGRGDITWIRRHFKQSLIGYAVFATVFCGVVAVFCEPILKAWVGSAVTASPTLVATLAVFGVVSSVASVFAFFYMSLGLNRRLAQSQIALVLIIAPASVLLIPVLGPPGAAIAATAGALLAFVIPGLAMRDQLFAKLEGSGRDTTEDLASS